MSAAPSQGATSVSPSSRNSLRLPLLLLVVASAGYIVRTAIPVVAPQLMSDFGLSFTQIGALSSAFLAGYTLCQVPSGWIADRVDPYRLFLILAICWTALTFACAVVNGSTTHVIGTLIGLRVLFGIFAAPTYPASARAVAAAIPPQSQARANGLVLASIGIGSAASPLLIAPLSEHFSWRVALLVVTAIAAAGAFVWWRFAQSTPRLAIAPQPEPTRAAVMLETKGTLHGHRSPQHSPLRGPSFHMLCASYFLQGYVGYIFVFWSFLYLREVRHFSLLSAASSTALPMLATTFAIPLGGVLSDAAVKRFGPTWGRRSLPLAALTLAGVFLMIAAFTPNAILAVVALSVCTVLVLSTEGPYWATVNQLAHTRGGVAGGIMNFGSNLGGMLSPVLTPWIAERFGWPHSLGIGAVLSMSAGLFWLFVYVRKPKAAPG